MQGELEWLMGLAADVLVSARIEAGASVAGSVPNTTGGALVRPGGRDCYPAFWVRDFAMSLESGLVAADDIAHALGVTLAGQANHACETALGGRIPEGAIADHLLFDGTPIYYPGTYDPAGQGPPWGVLPAFDNHYYVIEMAWQWIVGHGCHDGLVKEIDGAPVIDRLVRAFKVPPVDEQTQLVCCSDANRGVSFGFTDSIIHTGYLLFASLLRIRASRQLGELLVLAGQPEEAKALQGMATTACAHLPEVFGDASGLLKASTGKSAQPDVWGSAFALYLDVLDEVCAKSVAQALLAKYRAGGIAYRGNIRHVATDDDASGSSAWANPMPGFPKDQYQNGAYWGTPTGWVYAALERVSPEDAHVLFADYIAELREGDFRLSDGHLAPVECLHPSGHYQNPVYLTSATCPLAAIRRSVNQKI